MKGVPISFYAAAFFGGIAIPFGIVQLVRWGAGKNYNVKMVVNLGGATPKDKNYAIIIKVHPQWAPLGAAHFKKLVKHGHYDDSRVYNINFEHSARFGMPGVPGPDPELIQDDPFVVSNTRGTVAFARVEGMNNSRGYQVFINTGDNEKLDARGFTPFGEIDENGMEIVDQFFPYYGVHNQNPDDEKIRLEGNTYLDEKFPGLAQIIEASLLTDEL